MSGSHRVIIEVVMRFFVGADDEVLLRALLRFVLEHQYMSTPGPHTNIWRARIGAGMGVACAGEIADLTLAGLSEVGRVDGPGRHPALLKFWRFKDDILLVLGGPASVRRQWLEDYQRIAAPFSVEFCCAGRGVYPVIFLTLPSTAVTAGGMSVFWTPESTPNPQLFGPRSARQAPTPSRAHGLAPRADHPYL